MFWWTRRKKTFFTGGSGLVCRAGCFGTGGHRFKSHADTYFQMTEQNHKLFRSILWSSFTKNSKTVQNVMREKSRSSLAPFNFVASTLCSISQESLRNLGQCGLQIFFNKLSVELLAGNQWSQIICELRCIVVNRQSVKSDHLWAICRLRIFFNKLSKESDYLWATQNSC